MLFVIRIIRHLTLIISKFIKWIFHYSGAKYIYNKFNPSNELENLPTGLLWVVGIYVAFFGVASQRYENRIDIIENRANAIFAQLGVPSVQKMALSRIPRVQNMWCPKKPEIIWPHTPFISLFSNKNYKYEEMVAQLKETIEDWNKSLEGVDLRNAILKDAILNGVIFKNTYLKGANLKDAKLMGAKFEGTNLRDADFTDADLSRAIFLDANLRGAKGLTVKQLCMAKKIHYTEIDSPLEIQIEEVCPDRIKLGVLPGVRIRPHFEP